MTEQEILELKLDEVIDTMKHARTFIVSREKMYRDGVDLYDQLLAELQSMKEKRNDSNESH